MRQMDVFRKRDVFSELSQSGDPEAKLLTGNGLTKKSPTDAQEGNL
jgi:hypothetical protein